MSEESYEYLMDQNDLANGRSGDWRTPSRLVSLLISIRDWRLKGNRGKIARALNPLNRLGSLTQKEVDKAFMVADNGTPVILGIASHDWQRLRKRNSVLPKSYK